MPKTGRILILGKFLPLYIERIIYPENDYGMKIMYLMQGMFRIDVIINPSPLHTYTHARAHSNTRILIAAT